MKLVKSIFFLLFVNITANAQIQQVNNGRLDELVFYVGTNTIEYDKEAEGSPYLHEAFIPAKINGIEKTQFVRFNAVEGTIELKDNDQILTLSPSYNYTIKLLDGSNKTYETYSFTNYGSITTTSFFEKLYTSEKFSLFLKERIIYSPPKKAKSSYDQDVPGKFKKGNTIFYVTDLDGNSDALFEISKKKKNRSNLFKDQSKLVENFIKKEALKMNKKEDLIALLNFYFKNQ